VRCEYFSGIRLEGKGAKDTLIVQRMSPPQVCPVPKSKKEDVPSRYVEDEGDVSLPCE